MSNAFDSWDTELYHYGVLGMKWGLRKYQNPDGTLTEAGKKRYSETGEYGYVYKSHATKKYDRKAAKQAAKGNIEKAELYKKRADKSRELDKRELEYAKSVKTHGNIISRVLTGEAVGGKAYQQHVAMDGGKLSTGRKAFVAGLARFGGQPLAYIRKAGYIRSGEKSIRANFNDWLTKINSQESWSAGYNKLADYHERAAAKATTQYLNIKNKQTKTAAGGIANLAAQNNRVSKAEDQLELAKAYRQRAKKAGGR